MKKWLGIWVMFAATTVTLAQDPEFSQYYSAPLYLNPAFSGTSSDHRFIMNYRNQWPNITNGFVTYGVSYDYNLEGLNSGVGFLVTTDRAGSAGMRSTAFNFQYAYRVQFADKWMFSSGLNFGLGFRSIDFNRLIFYDQLEFDSNNTNIPSDDPTSYRIGNTAYFDFGAGGLIYSRKVWLGFAASHLNNPNRSLIKEEADIPVKLTVHGGVRIPLYNGVFKRDKVAAIMPSFVYKQQGRFDQLDFGTYFFYDPVVVGFWYRGIPIKQNVRDNISQDAVVVVLGFQLEKFDVSYSYDLTVSELGPIGGGAHEIAIKYHLDVLKSKKKKPEKFIPCPTFNR